MFDTRMLLKIVLNPDVYLLKNKAIQPEHEKVFVDLTQFIQENLLESALNPKYVKYSDVKNAMHKIEDAKVDSIGIERVTIHFLKLCFIINLILLQRGYPRVTVIPTCNHMIIDRFEDTTEIKGETCKSWNIIGDLKNFCDFFDRVTEGENLWKIEVLGSIFHEYPKSLNTLNSIMCFNTIVSSEIKPEILTILQSIYLAENYKCFMLMDTKVCEGSYEGVMRIDL